MGWSGGGAGLVTEGQETAALQSAAATAAKLEPKCCSITPACSRWLTFRIHTLCYYFILHYFRQSHNGACSSPNLVLGTRSQARLGDPLCPEQTGNVSWRNLIQLLIIYLLFHRSRYQWLLYFLRTMPPSFLKIYLIETYFTQTRDTSQIKGRKKIEAIVYVFQSVYW